MRKYNGRTTFGLLASNPRTWLCLSLACWLVGLVGLSTGRPWWLWLGLNCLALPLFTAWIVAGTAQTHRAAGVYHRAREQATFANARWDTFATARREAHGLGLPWVEADGSVSWPEPAPAERDQRTHDALHARRLAAERGDGTTAWPPTPAEWNAMLRESLANTVPPVSALVEAVNRKLDAEPPANLRPVRIVHDGYGYRWQYVEVPTTDLTE